VSDPVLAIERLSVTLGGDGGEVRAVEDLSLELARGESFALVGESGAGKSMLAVTLLGLAPPTARVEGSIRLAGAELVGASDEELRAVRGRRIAMVFQDPATALDPVQRVGRQVAEQIEAHDEAPRATVDRRVIELLEEVRLPNAADVARRYPFQLSGGMRQRVAIAAAISCAPAVLVADEPTAALDVVVQAQVLDLLADLRRERDMALLLATHDMRAVARIADRLAVIRAGRIIESGSVADVIGHPREAHTRALLRTPATRRRERGAAAAGPTLLEVTGLVVDFHPRRSLLGRDGAGGPIRAVSEVNVRMQAGETLGLVGASGSGKTTLARAILRLVEPSAGSIRLDGRELVGLRERALRPLRRQVQGVFQDPAASLNPRRTAGDAVAAPLIRNGVARRDAAERARLLLERVELEADHAGRFPHELSGGQRQRVGIARALALEPRLVILDEPVSALDAPVRAQVMDLLARLQEELDLAYLLISHDLRLVGRMADRVAVMDAGAVVEEGEPGALAERPSNPATRALVEASY
jgi:ABC-type glutathione transport system ATPase component